MFFDSLYPGLVFLYIVLSYEQPEMTKRGWRKWTFGILALLFILLCIGRFDPCVKGCGVIGLMAVCILKGIDRSQFSGSSVLRSRWMQIAIFAYSLSLMLIGVNECGERRKIRCHGDTENVGCSKSMFSNLNSDQKIKLICDAMFGENKYDNSEVEKKDEKEYSVVTVTLPEGTNVVFTVMKRDGRIYVDGNGNMKTFNIYPSREK